MTAPDVRKYKITYRVPECERDTELLATSKYNAKSRFYRENPQCEIIKVEEVSEDEKPCV